MNLILEKRRRRQEKTKEWSNLYLFKIAFFGHILKKLTHSFFGAQSSLLIHI